MKRYMLVKYPPTDGSNDALNQSGECNCACTIEEESYGIQGNYIKLEDFIHFIKGYIACIDLDAETMKNNGKTEIAKGLRRAKMLLDECLVECGKHELGD